MRVHAVRLGPEYLVFLLIVLFAVPLDGLAACVKSRSVPILTRVTTAINSSIYERWCQSGRLLDTASLASSHALPAKIRCPLSSADVFAAAWLGRSVPVA